MIIAGCAISTQKKQLGFSIPAAIFVLIVVAMLGAAMANILNQGQQSIAREVLSMRALMAAESGAERGLHQVLEVDGAACVGTLANPPASMAPLESGWQMLAPGMTSCIVNVSCGLTQVDSDNDGSIENYYTLRSTGACGPPADRAFRVVEVQARN